MIRLDILIPCKPFALGKSRLAPVLSPEAREALCRRLLRLTIRRARELGGRVAVAGNDPEVQAEARKAGVIALAEAGCGLNAALASANAALLQDGGEGAALLVLPIDLPLARPAALRRFLAAAGGHSAIAPDRAGQGTNLLLLSPGVRPGFDFAYGAGSARRHLASVGAKRAPVRLIEDRRFARDLDEPDDLYALEHALTFQRLRPEDV
jgi:2-phospho-L-lactate guanylyltransferase